VDGDLHARSIIAEFDFDNDNINIGMAQAAPGRSFELVSELR